MAVHTEDSISAIHGHALAIKPQACSPSDGGVAVPHTGLEITLRKLSNQVVQVLTHAQCGHTAQYAAQYAKPDSCAHQNVPALLPNAALIVAELHVNKSQTCDLTGLRVAFYSGLLDTAIPFPGTTAVVQTLSQGRAQQLKRQPWFTSNLNNFGSQVGTLTFLSLMLSPTRLQGLLILTCRIPCACCSACHPVPPWAIALTNPSLVCRQSS